MGRTIGLRMWNMDLPPDAPHFQSASDSNGSTADGVGLVTPTTDLVLPELGVHTKSNEAELGLFADELSQPTLPQDASGPSPTAATNLVDRILTDFPEVFSPAESSFDECCEDMRRNVQERINAVWPGATVQFGEAFRVDNESSRAITPTNEYELPCEIEGLLVVARCRLNTLATDPRYIPFKTRLMQVLPDVPGSQIGGEYDLESTADFLQAARRQDAYRLYLNSAKPAAESAELPGPTAESELKAEHETWDLGRCLRQAVSEHRSDRIPADLRQRLAEIFANAGLSPGYARLDLSTAPAVERRPDGTAELVVYLKCGMSDVPIRAVRTFGSGDQPITEWQLVLLPLVSEPSWLAAMDGIDGAVEGVLTAENLLSAVKLAPLAKRWPRENAIGPVLDKLCEGYTEDQLISGFHFAAPARFRDRRIIELVQDSRLEPRPEGKTVRPVTAAEQLQLVMRAVDVASRIEIGRQDLATK